jgi:hypothetical protein
VQLAVFQCNLNHPTPAEPVGKGKRHAQIQKRGVGSRSVQRTGTPPRNECDLAYRFRVADPV